MKKFLLLLLLFPHFAFASFASGGAYYSLSYSSFQLLNRKLAASPQAACDLSVTQSGINYAVVFPGHSTNLTATYDNRPPTACAFYSSGSWITGSGPVTSTTCPANSTGTTTCTCASGYSQTSTTPIACYIRATSPNGATAPVGPLGQAPIAIAGAIALGILGVAGAILGAPLLGVAALGSAALASGLIASPGFFGGAGAPNTAPQQFSASGSPLSVSLVQSDTYSPGLAGSAGAVGVNTSGAFVPGGGGTYTGSGGTGGWSAGGATGEWTYSQPVPGGTAVPIAAITDGGYTYRAITSVGSGSVNGSVVGQIYTDGSTTVTEARTVPVLTSGGVVTTADVGVVNTFGPDGARLPGGSSATIGPTLGNGTPSGGGSGLAFIGAGSGAGGGTGAGSGVTKIDESGTPSPVSSDYYKHLADGWKSQADTNQYVVKGSGDKQFFSSWDTFFTAPAVVACTPYQLPRDMGSLDPCPVVSGVRVVMGYLWAIGALFLCIGMVRKTV